MARLHRWTHAKIKLFLLIAVFSLAGLALAGQAGLLPAQNWKVSICGGQLQIQVQPLAEKGPS